MDSEYCLQIKSIYNQLNSERNNILYLRELLLASQKLLNVLHITFLGNKPFQFHGLATYINTDSYKINWIFWDSGVWECLNWFHEGFNDLNFY
jgi:hypothetical protein